MMEGVQHIRSQQVHQDDHPDDHPNTQKVQVDHHKLNNCAKKPSH